MISKSVKILKSKKIVWPCTNKKRMKQGLLRTKLILKFICISLCALCFVYQTQQLVSIYLSGKTIVENRVQRLKYSQMPAITVCLPTFMDMEKFSLGYLNSSQDPFHKILFKEFVEFNKSVEKNGRSEAQNMQGQLYDKIVFEVFMKSNISMNEMFGKFTADINISHKWQYNEAFNEKGDVVPLSLPIQIHSIAPFLDPRKCITIFSVFDKFYKNTKLKIILLVLLFEHKNMSFPYNKYYDGDFYIALHSSNILPNYERDNIFQKMNMGKINFITYSESQTKLLQSPYQTNCREYKTDGNGLRSDCLHNCVNSRLEEKFNLNCTWTFANFKLVRENSPIDKPFCNYTKELLLREVFTEQNKLQNICEEFCPKNCFESFYSYEIETRKGDFFNETRNRFSISIEHNRFPDQVIEHKPILDWITLISNSGGLMGMWLGMSFSLIINKLLDRLFAKYLEFL